MESIPKHHILKHKEGTLEAVRKLHNLDKPGEMNEALDILEKWIKQQEHFVKKEFRRHRLEMTLLSSKGSIEKAKARLDKLCTIRGLLPQYFKVYDMKKDFELLNTFTYRAILPKLTDDYIRIVVLKPVGSKVHSTFLMETICLSVLYAEYALLHDYNDGFAFIIDITELDVLELLSKLYISELRNGVTVVMEAIGLRLKGLHLVSPSGVLEKLVKLIKAIVNEKIASRIFAHTSMDTVYDYIPQEILPMEYGGKERSLKTLADEWLDAVCTEKFKVYLTEMQDAYTDESKRSKKVFQDTYMGLPGTFRTLSVD